MFRARYFGGAFRYKVRGITFDCDLEQDARRYRLLRDYLLLNGLIRHVELPESESDPFFTGMTFYGPTFGDAVDTLELRN
jgi:hypothetical protein